MSETIKQKIEREIKEKLAAMPQGDEHYKKIVVGPTCPLCGGLMHNIGPMAMACNACGAQARR